MVNFRIKNAQAAIEYALVLVCIIAALYVMQHYIKRAAQGRLREAADSIGGQYDPRHATSAITTLHIGGATMESRMVRQEDERAESGRIDGVQTVTRGGETTWRTGSQSLGEFPDELFD